MFLRRQLQRLNLRLDQIVSKTAFGLLIVLLLMIGYYQELIFSTLHHYSKFFISMLGYGLADAPHYSVESEQTATDNARKVAMLSYRMMYIGMSVLTIQFYFNNYTKTKLATGLYTMAMVSYLILYSFSKSIDSEQVLLVAIRIDSIILSPMLTLLLIISFHLSPPK